MGNLFCLGEYNNKAKDLWKLL